jgi:hypothetical protein
MSDSFAPTDKVNPVTLAFPCIPRYFVARFKAFITKTFGRHLNFWYEGGPVEKNGVILPHVAAFVWFYATEWEKFPPDLRKIFLDIAAGESAKIYYDGKKFLHVRKSNYPEHNHTNTLVVPDTVVPDTVVPDTVVPDTVVPDTVVPETEPEIEFGI